MSPARKKRRKVLVKSRKTLSMEEKSPTMPSVVFLKYLKITGEIVDRWISCRSEKKRVFTSQGMMRMAVEGVQEGRRL